MTLQPRVLTLWQPWASLVASGTKRIETRSWQTPHRGPVIIHAAKRRVDAGLRVGRFEAERHPDRSDDRMVDTVYNRDPLPIPYGKVVAVATLTDCLPVHTYNSKEWAEFVTSRRRVDYDYIANNVDNPFLPESAHCLSVQHTRVEGPERQTEVGWSTVIDDQFPYGDFTPGRFGWMLENVRPLPVPILWNGMQGLPTAPKGLIERIDKQLDGWRT